MTDKEKNNYLKVLRNISSKKGGVKRILQKAGIYDSKGRLTKEYGG
jgi:hypothetical protein